MQSVDLNSVKSFRCPSNYFFTSVGKKLVMGISGLVWAGFVMGHMAGNMLMFISPGAYNSYGHALTSGGLIYVVETVLLTALSIHVFFAVWLTVDNRRARGSQGYALSQKGSKGASIASRTMAAQGSLILAFIIFHLITFKFGPVYETTVNGVQMRDLHRLMVEVFQQPGYFAWYVFCLLLLGVHLRHGISSIFQSLGVLNSNNQATFQKVGIVYAIVVSLGFLSQPISVFLSR